MFNIDNDEDTMDISEKEEEIIRYYNDEYEEDMEEDSEEEEYSDTEEYSDIEEDSDEEEYEEYTENGVLERNRNSKLIRDILISIVILITLLVIIDIIAVSSFDKGPFFAIRTKTYNDGGTKEYYGLGYKVIKYHQVQGRRDKELGFWTLDYNTNALTVKDKDIATAYIDNSIDAYRKYHNKFVRIKSTLQEVDPTNSRITMAYIDENSKYSIRIVCDVVRDQINLTAFEVNKKITIIGTVKEFKKNSLYISYCFAEQ